MTEYKHPGERGGRRSASGHRGAPYRRPAGPPQGEPPKGLRLLDVDELEIRIEKLVTGGEGLARYEGIPIFVPCSAPGDLLKVRLKERRPDYGRAEIVEILEAGPGRRTPPCPHYEQCGGCDLQHLGEDHQLRLKAEAVRETLERIGRVEMPSDVTVLAGQPWGYRLRTQLQIGETERGMRAGYFARGSHDLVPVERCPILVPELEEQLVRLPLTLTEDSPQRLDLAAGDDASWTTSPVLDPLPQGEVTTTVGDMTYAHDARCFFQGHRQLLPSLVEQAIGDDDGDLAVDLYAGVGLFSLPLAQRYGRVVAVEGDRVAVRYAKNNARRNKLTNVTVDSIAVDGWLKREGNWNLEPSRVVVDPPRDGLSANVRKWLRERRPAGLTYVSCHVATLARDLKFLLRGFRMERIALLDMFPQTGHMEVVVQLVSASD